MTQSKRLMRSALVIGVILIAAMLFCANNAFASSGDWGKTTHIGKYYFKYNENTNRVYISKKKSSGFKKTPVDDKLFVSNGKQMIYVTESGSKHYLKSYDISSKKTRKLKKLPKKSSWVIRGAKGNYIWMDGMTSHGDYYSIYLYRYNIATQSIQKYKAAANLSRLHGNYYFCVFGKSKKYTYISFIFGKERMFKTKAYICKLTNSGSIKKIKYLGYYCEVESHYLDDTDNWGSIKTLYFSKNNSHDLYRVKYNGKKLKKVKSFKRYYITEIDKKSCTIENKNDYDIYNY